MLTVGDLRSLFKYDQESGILTWARGTRAGRRAGYVGKNGYWKVMILGANYYAHRIGWALQIGNWPEGEIDHINRDPSDNRMVNLRLATHRQNLFNVGLSKANTSGFQGVSLVKATNRYRAYYGIDGKYFHVGNFDTAEEAAAAREVAIAYRGEFRPAAERVARASPV